MFLPLVGGANGQNSRTRTVSRPLMVALGLKMLFCLWWPLVKLESHSWSFPTLALSYPLWDWARTGRDPYCRSILKIRFKKPEWSSLKIKTTELDDPVWCGNLKTCQGFYLNCLTTYFSLPPSFSPFHSSSGLWFELKCSLYIPLPYHTQMSFWSWKHPNFVLTLLPSTLSIQMKFQTKISIEKKPHH